MMATFQINWGDLQADGGLVEYARAGDFVFVKKHDSPYFVFKVFRRCMDQFGNEYLRDESPDNEGRPHFASFTTDDYLIALLGTLAWKDNANEVI